MFRKLLNYSRFRILFSTFQKYLGDGDLERLRTDRDFLSERTSFWIFYLWSWSFRRHASLKLWSTKTPSQPSPFAVEIINFKYVLHGPNLHQSTRIGVKCWLNFLENLKNRARIWPIQTRPSTYQSEDGTAITSSWPRRSRLTVALRNDN